MIHSISMCNSCERHEIDRNPYVSTQQIHVTSRIKAIALFAFILIAFIHSTSAIGNKVKDYTVLNKNTDRCPEPYRNEFEKIVSCTQTNLLGRCVRETIGDTNLLIRSSKYLVSWSATRHKTPYEDLAPVSIIHYETNVRYRSVFCFSATLNLKYFPFTKICFIDNNEVHFFDRYDHSQTQDTNTLKLDEALISLSYFHDYHNNNEFFCYYEQINTKYHEQKHMDTCIIFKRSENDPLTQFCFEVHNPEANTLKECNHIDFLPKQIVYPFYVVISGRDLQGIDTGPVNYIKSEHSKNSNFLALPPKKPLTIIEALSAWWNQRNPKKEL